MGQPDRGIDPAGFNVSVPVEPSNVNSGARIETLWLRRVSLDACTVPYPYPNWRPKMRVIEMVDADGLPRWIGLATDSGAEWWRSRHHYDNSLSRWLRTLDDPPELSNKWLPNVQWRRPMDAMPMLRHRVRQIVDWCGGHPPWLYNMRLDLSSQPVAFAGPRGGNVRRFGSVRECADWLGWSRDWTLRKLATGRIGTGRCGRTGRVLVDDLRTD